MIINYVAPKNNDVVENFSLRFDRAFYSSALILQVGEGIKDELAIEAVSKIERELFAQVSGLEIFAERVGLRWNGCCHFLWL